jgi:hypothetical protein
MMMKWSTLSYDTALVVLLAASTACERQREPAFGTTDVTTTSATVGSPDHVCPMGVRGAAVRAVDVVGGIALDLTTESGEADVAELRRRVVVMSQHGSMGRMAGPSGGHGGRGALHSGTPAPATEVRLETIPHGERVTLLTGDPAKVDGLRARARAHAAKMGGGACERAGKGPPSP